MLSIRRYSMVSLQTLLVICTVLLQLPEGQARSCNIARCYSRSYRLTICRHAAAIVNATVFQRLSYATCRYYSGLPGQYKGYGGVFGFYRNILWTKKGCKAKFKVCYSVPTPPSTTASTTLKVSSPTPVKVSSKQTSGTTHPLESLSITSDVHTNTSHYSPNPKLETSSKIIVATVLPSLLIFVGVIVIGKVLVMKRQKRKHISDEQKTNEGKTNTGLAAKRTNEAATHADKDVLSNENTYYVLDPQGQYATYISDVKENNQAITTNESANTSTRSASKYDSHKYFILDPQRHSISDKTETREDSVRQQITSNAISERNFSSSGIDDSYDLYSSCDQETVDIQMLPNYEYNVINLKRNVTGNESNYDVLSSLQFTKEVAEADEYSHIGNIQVIVRDDTYSHITLNQESERN